MSRRQRRILMQTKSFLIFLTPRPDPPTWKLFRSEIYFCGFHFRRELSKHWQKGIFFIYLPPSKSQIIMPNLTHDSKVVCVSSFLPSLHWGSLKPEERRKSEIHKAHSKLSNTHLTGERRGEASCINNKFFMSAHLGRSKARSEANLLSIFLHFLTPLVATRKEIFHSNDFLSLTLTPKNVSSLNFHDVNIQHWENYFAKAICIMCFTYFWWYMALGKKV